MKKQKLTLENVKNDLDFLNNDQKTCLIEYFSYLEMSNKNEFLKFLNNYQNLKKEEKKLNLDILGRSIISIAFAISLITYQKKYEISNIKNDLLKNHIILSDGLKYFHKKILKDHLEDINIKEHYYTEKEIKNNNLKVNISIKEQEQQIKKLINFIDQDLKEFSL